MFKSAFVKGNLMGLNVIVHVMNGLLLYCKRKGNFMIEQVKSERKNNEKQDVLFNMPKNVRQIGQATNERKIYIEDYVMSYVRYLGKEATEQYKIAVLLGEVKEWEGSACIFISGALEVEGVQIEECNCFPKEIWEGIYHLIEENFDRGSIVGWIVTKAGMMLEPSEWLEKLHIDNFAGQDKTLMLYDALEREEAFFLFDEKHLKRVPGYYIYYEKNHEMQNYMLQKKGTVEQEKVDDYVIVEMRKKMSEMDIKKKKPKKGKRYFQGAGLICATLMVAALSQNENIQTKICGMFSGLSRETVLLQQESAQKTEKADFLEMEQSKISKSNEEVGEENGTKKEIEKKEQPQSDVDVTKIGNVQEQYYTIQPGDTLVSICMKEFQSLDRMEEIMQINNITNKDKIVAGQKIKLWE